MMSLAARTHYDVLGVSRHASIDEVKDAYRALVKKWHPDVNHTAEAETRFKEIQKSFAVLNNYADRSDYDAELRSIEASNLPRDAMDIIMDRFGATAEHSTPRRPKVKKVKKQKLKKAHVFLDEVPDGFGDDTLGEIIPEA
jgi:DnaJ-class molecular chaperone